MSRDMQFTGCCSAFTQFGHFSEGERQNHHHFSDTVLCAELPGGSVNSFATAYIKNEIKKERVLWKHDYSRRTFLSNCKLRAQVCAMKVTGM